MTELPIIELLGPPIPRPPGMDPKKPFDHAFWVLRAVSPDFGVKNVEDRKGVQEDRITPLRTTHLDASATTFEDKPWRGPRLMTLHVIAGGPDKVSDNDERLGVKFGEGIHTFNAGHKEFRTVHRDDLSKASFCHVAVEPVVDGAWPRDTKQKVPPMGVPQFRLVAGAVDVLGNAGDLEWLGGFATRLPIEKKQKILIRFTPDGIEIQGTAPFPGRGSLEGRFLLHLVSDGVRLSLLPDRLSETELTDWSSAWRAATPATDVAGTAIAGLRVASRVDGVPPAFEWDVTVLDGKGIQALTPSVTVPATALDVRLVSPRGRRGIDGEVTLKPRTYRLAELPVKPPEGLQSIAGTWTKEEVPVALITELPPVAGPDGKLPKLTSRLLFDAQRLISRATMVAIGVSPLAHRCAHDETALASSLRRAYGLAEVRPGQANAAMPMLAAFVPLDDGWAQLAVPNLPPPDVTKDDIVVPAAPAIGNVLSGYLRFAQSGDLPAVLSAFGSPLAVDEAPWVVTIEGAKAAALAIGLRVADGGAQLLRAAVALDDPELSTRGLLRVSADRPDALEALPRLGAGAGAYFDIPLETYDIEKQTAVQFTLAELALHVERTEEDAKGETPTASHKIVRDKLALSVAFDRHSPTEWQKVAKKGRDALEVARKILTGKALAHDAAPATLPPVRWQRHPQMPLAAEMPMTRGAASAVRPLESRDLVPLVVDPGTAPDDEPLPLLRFEWSNTVFPAVRRPDRTMLVVRRIAAWPHPQAPAATTHERGIALAAFGVPGAELAPAASPNDAGNQKPWPPLAVALRYDLPVLDEAFATATLPPPPPDGKLSSELETAPEAPVPLAYDWTTMERFWADQDRRHQVARVAHSYLFRDKPAGIVSDTPIADLVGGMTWTTPAGFREPATGELLPYGSAFLGSTTEKLSGNRALLGLTRDLKKNGDVLESNGSDVTIVGFAPASFREDGFLMDSRRSGIRKLMSRPQDLLWRPIRDRESGGITGLATLTKPISAGRFFDFWFKDLPLRADGVFERPSRAVAFDVWQDGKLCGAGFEWRLIPASGVPESIFRIGRDRIPFFGFALEPLRLEKCTLAMSGDAPSGGVRSATILARLHLGRSPERASHDGNLVTISLVADGAQLKIEAFDARDLRYSLPGAMPVRVRMKCSWNAGRAEPAFTIDELAVTMFGGERIFKGAVLTASTNDVNILWPRPPEIGQEPPAETFDVTAGKGIVRLRSIEVRTGVGDDGQGTDAVTTVVRRILLTPVADGRIASAKSEAALQVLLTNESIDSVKVLGISFPSGNSFAYKEQTGAFTLTRVPAELPGGATLLPTIPVTGKLSLGLVAAVGPVDQNGEMELTAGYLDGEIVDQSAAPARIKLSRVMLGAVCGRRDSKTSGWNGAIRLHGAFKLTNAIRWPKIANAEALQPIPIPGQDPNGRYELKIEPNTSYTHVVEYALDGHSLPFDVAMRLAALDAGTVWTTPVVAKHAISITAGDAVGDFSCVETIAIGAADAIVPRPVLKADPVTFAPRRAATIVNGSPSSTQLDAGMLEDHLGRIGTVLSGALGLSLRTVFPESARAGLLLTGGFCGLLSNPGAPDDHAPLLRLPVLVPLSAEHALSIPQSGVSTVEVAWADGPSARDLIATVRSAVSPSSASESAIRKALLAGSRAVAAEGAERSVAAVLVEQSFAVPRSAPAVDKTPFFIGAAVTLERNLKRIADRGARTVLSLLAGHAVAKTAGARGLAAAIVTRKLETAAVTKRSPETVAELVTLGRDVVVRPWTGPDVAGLAGVIPVSMIAAPAFADHVEPLAVLLRTDTSAMQWRYDSQKLPRSFERARVATTFGAAHRAFADTGRGHALPPGDEPLRWLAGPEDATMIPFQDGDPVGDKSGLAGLSRITSLPAHAWDVRPAAGEDRVRRGLVWIAQTRAPVFLPLELGGVSAPPIPWLTPGTPRPRNPAASSVSEAFRRLEFAVDAKHGEIGGVQPILPGGATVASVGDRAGVSMARIARCETALGTFSGFDGRYTRFGRPAQGGSWSARTERTPRPGVLPKNVDDPKRSENNRRPCASPILPRSPLTALAALADRVMGDEAGLPAWSVTFAIAPTWNGMVTESWDGTIELRAEIDVAGLANETTPAVEALFRRLFPPVKDKPTSVQARAQLVIGTTVIPFVRMHLIDENPAGIKLVKTTVGQDAIHRAVVKLVLDARSTDATRGVGAAIPAIAEAFAVETLPAVEVRLIVSPDSGETAVADVSKREVGLTIDDPNQLIVPNGGSRAPVMLRMPLAPVIRARGALPLAPTSIFFNDRSYDAGLSSMPAGDRRMLATKNANLPPARGALFATLYADRDRIHRKASVTFMIDVAYEKKVDAATRALLDERKVDGDIVSTTGAFNLALAVVPKDAVRRTLFVRKPKSVPAIALARVYELSLASLVEEDGKPAALAAGDMLEIQVAEANKGAVAVTVTGKSSAAADDVAIGELHDAEVTRVLRILLTDEPVVEPPPSLFAALVRRATPVVRLSLPLYAQSPLPWRVDLRNAKKDFRDGLMRRSATFLWMLTRPEAERGDTTIFVVKADRNGQTFLPMDPSDFLPAREL